MIEDLNKYAREIIEKNEYLSLSTLDDKKGTWICVLCYAYDNDWNFYFASIDTSRHSVNISRNNNVSFAIYDSHQDWGTGIGLQIEGVVEKVKDSVANTATNIYFSRKFPYGSVGGSLPKGLRNC